MSVQLPYTGLYKDFRMPRDVFRQPVAVREHAVRQSGFTGWDTPKTLVEGLEMETAELRDAVLKGVPASQQEGELGDVLFYASLLANAQGLNPRRALTECSDKFIRRVTTMEQLHNQRQPGVPFRDFSRRQWETYWGAAKAYLADNAANRKD